jgi:hypothetical protein
MRRDRAGKRSRWLSLLVAAFVGYLVGDWHAAALRSATTFLPTASQSVALRFPEARADTPGDAVAEMPTGSAPPARATLNDAQLALFSPVPMVPVVRPAPAATPPVDTTPAEAPAAAAPPLPESRPVEKAIAPAPSRPARQSALDTTHHAGRPGFMLNDAQIASIKDRLHLSPDQERMWPAVEAALRNIAYAKTRAHRHGAPAEIEAASLDADSAEVQGLKSAAIPLIMSFNDEQKSEVRSLAHVMGLDQLASEF